MEGEEDWRSSDEYIDKRLKFYERWDDKNVWASDVKEVEEHLKFGYRCQGVLEALCNKYLDEVEDDEFFEVIMDTEKPMKEAYEILMEAIERGKP